MNDERQGGVDGYLLQLFSDGLQLTTIWYTLLFQLLCNLLLGMDDFIQQGCLGLELILKVRDLIEKVQMTAFIRWFQ